MKEGTVTMSLAEYEEMISVIHTVDVLRRLAEDDEIYVDSTIRSFFGFKKAEESETHIDLSGFLPKPEPKEEPKPEPEKMEYEKPKAMTAAEAKAEIAAELAAEDDEPEEKSHHKYPAPKKGGNKAILDVPKMAALRRAGWTYAKIAIEMHCSEQTVINRLAAENYDKDGIHHD